MDNVITPLKERVFLAKVTLEGRSLITKPLLRLLFFSSRRKDRFFSITETEEGVSLIVDEHSLSYFPRDCLSNISPPYRAIRIFEGPDAIDEIGYVGRLSGALASHDIKPLIYLSTFNSDILLVIEHHFDSALDVLTQSTLTSSVSLQSDPPITASSASTKPANRDMSSLVPSVELTVRPSILELCSLNLEKLHSYEHSLIKALVFSDEIDEVDEFTSTTTPITTTSEQPTEAGARLFSLTFCLDEMTMIASPKIKKLFDPTHLHASNPFTWCTLEVHEGEIAGLEKTSWLSEILAENRVSIYYLSSCDTDFILVKEPQIQHALQCLLDKLN